MAENKRQTLSIHCPNATPATGKQGMLRISIGAPDLDSIVDEKRIVVTFAEPIPNLPPPEKHYLLQARYYSLTGGQRILPRIISAERYDPRETPPELCDRRVLLVLDKIGDFSIYTLTVSEPNDSEDIDPFFASKKVRFRIQCDDPFDCRPRQRESPASNDLAVAIDYLTKDYAGFRQALIEFVPTRMPAWTERNEADIGMMLLELFAAAADTLSYMQDRVANEAFLDSADQRRSVAGHLALIDYEMDQGASAFTWLQFQVSKEITLPDRADSPGLRVRNKPIRADEAVVVFETHHECKLLPDLNEMPVFVGSNADCCLPIDALSLTLAEHYSSLQKGDYLLLDDGQGHCDVVRLTAEPSSSHGRTTISWSKSTSLRHSYCVRAFDRDLRNGVLTNVDPCNRTIAIGMRNNRTRFDVKRLQLARSAEITLDGKQAELAELKGDAALFVQYQLSPCQCFVDRMIVQTGPRLVVRGNLVPATHGESFSELLLDMQKQTAPKNQIELDRLLDRGFRLSRGPLAYLDSETPLLPQPDEPPEPLPRGQPHSVSTLKVKVGKDDWYEKPTLLYSSVNDKDFRVEIDDEGDATIRFGKKKLDFGSRPVFDFTGNTANPTTISATYRVGGGVVGNIAAATLVEVQPHEQQPPAGIVSVTNPLPAVGGRDLESRDHARRYAPADFKKPLVALTAADYQAAAEEFVYDGTKAIQRANAAFRWTGSWLTATLALDPFRSEKRDGDLRTRQNELRTELLSFLENRRLAAYDLEITNRAPYVPLELEIRICLKPGSRADLVRRDVLESLSSTELSGGRKGFFHPDNFTFGQRLYVSRLFATMSGRPGVEAAHITRLCRFRAADFQRQTDANLAQGYLDVAADEIIRLDNDRNFPENGTLRVLLMGGGA